MYRFPSHVAAHRNIRASDEAPTPLPPSNRIDQRLQHQAICGIGPLDWLKRRAYTKSA